MMIIMERDEGFYGGEMMILAEGWKRSLTEGA